MSITQHPLGEADRAAMIKMREATAGAKGSLAPSWRAMFDDLMGHTPIADGVTCEAATVGGVAGYWVRPHDARPGEAIVYLHGGAYVIGSARAYQGFASQIASRAQASAFVADYRLAPEHPYPAALDDALAVYAGIAGHGATSIALVGDSAGGGLTLALLALATADAAVKPRGAAVMSPWADLALTGDSLRSRDAADPLLTRASLEACAALYLAGHDAHDPRVSPIDGDLRGLPPVRIHVGEDEILLDDSRRYAARFEAAGGDIAVHVWEGMTHVFPSSVGVLAAAGAALDDLGAFVRDRLRGR